ncbi:uncharacterized protein LOC121371047 [Gigantopelta aegis]|uniref:uncharacterized protein LOC121371047 n=1 Tax=Gigantopelta aegis TaxID=1735272 RepID=UPI001B887FAD|nr:uncharacterized protein LOC121371047 [Gigantopelta aegis]
MLFHATFSCCLVVVTFVFGLALSQDNNVKECLSGQKEDRSHKVSLSCPAGLVISVGEAFFGRNDWGACSLTLDDCTEKVNLFSTCQWKSNCTVFFSGIFIPTCAAYATVLRVYYDCVDESTIPVGEEVSTVESILHDVGGTQQKVPTKGGYLQDPAITSTGDDDVALIAGCAAAVVVTTIVLIIAIVLVVRRLVGSNTESTQNKPQGRLSFFICTKLGCAKFVKERHPPSTVVEAPSPAGTEDGESELRVAPVGADSAEEVFESDRQTSGADATQTTTPEGTSSVVQTDVSVTIENETDIVSQNTEINSRSSHNEEMTNGTNINMQSSGAEPDESSQSVNQEEHRSSSGLRMDAVAVPNTELSTLC